MASPLILKIQAELERRGFDDVNRQIDRLQKAIRGLGDEFQETEKKSGGFLTGIVTGVIALTAALTAAGIVQERTLAQLSNTLEDIGLDAEDTADSIQDLTNSMVRNSVFGAGELRDSLAVLTRSTRSLTLAANDLLIAQELSLRNNISLEQATKAVAAANQGDGRALANLTQLRLADIEAAQEQGALRELLAEAIPIGEATGRDLATISGAIDKFTNRATAGFFEVGEVVLEKFQVPIQGTIGLIEGATDALDFFLDSTIFANRRATEQTALLEAEFEQVNRALNLIGQSGVKSFGDLEQAISDIDVGLNTFTKLERELTSEEKAQQEALRDTRLEVTELQRTQSLLGKTTLRQQIDVFRQLSVSREDFQRQDLQNQLRNFEALRDADTLRGEEALINQQLITNAKLKLAEFEKDVAIGNIEEEIDVRRQLFALLQAPAEAIDETTSIEERGRALDRLTTARKENLLLIENERIAALAVLELERQNEGLLANDRRIANRRRIIEAQALNQELEAQQAFIAAAVEVGTLPGRPDLRARAEAEVDTLLRQQTVTRNTQIRQDEDQVRNKRVLINLERTLVALSKQGGEEVGERLALVLNEASRIREAIGEAIIPSSEEDIEKFATELERKLDIPDININFNLDRLTLIAEIRTILAEDLALRGFSIARETTAPSATALEEADEITEF